MNRLASQLGAWMVVGLVGASVPVSARSSREKPGAVVAPTAVRTVKTDAELPPAVKDALQTVLNDPALATARVGVMVYDVDDDRVLAESGADTLINPASNAKLVTAASALGILGADYRWKTEYFTSGPVKDGVLKGDLVVKGYGDPSVVSERLQAVADKLYLAGIRRITGNVIVDDTAFDGIGEAAGWELEDAPDRAYAAPVGALSLNYNSIGVAYRPSARGAPAVIELEPPVEYATLEAAVSTGRYTRRLNVGTKAEKLSTRVIVDGEIGGREPPRRIYRRIYHPSRYFGSALVKFLQQRGVDVKHRVIPATVPLGSTLVLVDESPSLSRVVADLNHFSNNFIAETIVKTIGLERRGAPATFKDGLAEMRAFLSREVGIVEGSYVLGNGSGLNDVNRFTARDVVMLLDYVDAHYELAPDFVASLAVAGTQGTIRHRMRDGPALRRVRAKTGTLRGVSALSGYVVDPREKVLAFSILVEGYGYDVRVAQIWAIQDQIVEALASDGESFAPVTDTPKSDAVALSVVEPQAGGNP
jgi:D-alanyl-D-alanine carboxypeptidase/D-alanyl-D-alanine-endopeptidase (penicillin-binding protein 4)